MVKWFDAAKGFGFIAPDGGGADVFVHLTAVERAGWLTLEPNQRVEFELEQDRRGKLSAAFLRAG
jgi:CspA family cold shock protein